MITTALSLSFQIRKFAKNRNSKHYMATLDIAITIIIINFLNIIQELAETAFTSRLVHGLCINAVYLMQ
jgi:hypothetical protein